MYLIYKVVLLYNKTIQLFMCTHPFSFRFFSHTDDHGVLGSVLRAVQQSPVGPSFHRPQPACASPKPSPSLPPTPVPLGNHMFFKVWVCFYSANKFICILWILLCIILWFSFRFLKCKVTPVKTFFPLWVLTDLPKLTYRKGFEGPKCNWQQRSQWNSGEFSNVGDS